MRNAYVRKGGKLDSFFFTYNKLLFEKRHTVQLDGERSYIIHSDINFDRDWSVCIDLQVQVQQTIRSGFYLPYKLAQTPFSEAYHLAGRRNREKPSRNQCNKFCIMKIQRKPIGFAIERSTCVPVSL